jgi:predicted DsbA family dithiol-disulfide isomerase
MAGLLPSWQYFADHISAITKPIQMGPEWMHARTLTGVPIDERIWITDPPGSSFPACIAVKAAGLQLPPAAKWYFDAVQKAVLTEQRNIARTSVLLQIAEELARENSRFNCHRFADDLLGLEARQEFKQDVMDWKYLQIGRLPAIIIRNGNGRRSILSGYQPLEILSRAADLLDKG